ncbi:unnamed protein product [Allacma fusca]|uniref:limulus clotting factor C n=1 Tax=Allacma fusca TaxID=39272 RepID=A0A8J2LFW1_9HEXA|nr:unnamed protein product [Allacma fusca]
MKTEVLLLFIFFSCNCAIIENTKDLFGSEKNPTSVKNKSVLEFHRSLTVAKRKRVSSEEVSCDCGTRIEGITNRIVGGSRARRNEFPWRCSLFTKFLRNYSVNESVLLYGYKFYCGCTILSEKWVMTAAHCTYDSSVQGNIYVFAGDNKLGPPEDGTGQLVPVRRIYSHPNYDNVSSDNDISLLELTTSLQFGENVRPACLPYKLKKHKFYKQNGTISGWGLKKYRDKISSEYLRKVSLPILTTKQCRKFFKGFPVNVTDNMFCTYTPRKDSCQGDSGGSLDLKDSETGRYFAIGVVSWGIGCAYNNIPGVFAKVTKYLKFLDATSGEKFCRVR